MMTTSHAALKERFRTRLLSELHIGHLRTGDRLPPIRELARELNADHRAVAELYRGLAAEGLVELRGRAGAYVAAQQRLGGEIVEETARWLATTLADARTRRITVPDLPEFIRRCTASVRLQCACIDSNEDAASALAIELAEDFGFQAVLVPPDALGNPKKKSSIPTEVLHADLLVTSLFHGAAVAAFGQQLKKPTVVATVAPEMAGIIERRVAEGGLTVIAVDPKYGERFKSVYGTRPGVAAGIRVVLSSDAGAIARLSRSEPVLVTRAARRKLPDLDLPLLLTRYPSISADSGREIIEWLIRLNMDPPSRE